MVQKPKKGLGKGLNALIGSSSTSIDIDGLKGKTGVLEIDINKIEPNKNQPRKFFDEEALEELAESIKNFGVIQPLILKDEGTYYSIIAGERRWRAARIAKIKKLPAIVKEYNEAETLQIALIENIQREDLNPIEEALCYKRLSDEFLFSQEDISNKVGKKRTVISLYMTLLNLDERVKTFLEETKIAVGHGKILLQLEDKEEQFTFAEHIIEDNLSIKQLEEIVKKYNENKILKAEEENNKKSDKLELKNNNEIYNSIEAELKTILGTKVKIKNGNKKGKIEIEYYSSDELDRLLGLFKNIYLQ